MHSIAKNLSVAAFILISGLFASRVALGASEDDPSKRAANGCLFRDSRYGAGMVICVGPSYGQECGEDGRWKDSTNQPPFDKICASAKTAIPGEASQCTYHDVKYSPGALICVAPRYGQICDKAGSWSATREDACLHAQIPAPAYPVTPSTTK